MSTSDFQLAYPEYATTARLDELRAAEYDYLDRAGHVYLDYTGAGLAARGQLAEHARRLSGALFGNPHSENPTSLASTELVESARRAVLHHLRASPDEYAVIFTPNATGACRLVAEAYPFGPDRRLVLTVDNHNSVNGIREYARRRSAPTIYTTALDEGVTGPGLFAYPAQSNFTGEQHPLDWVEQAHARGLDVLLDAAAYLPTNALDLSEVRADFVPLSFYKIFGYPTGIGALVARRETLARLRRPWFSGGTIQAVSVQGDWHRLMGDESAFEDGTLNFLSIPDVEFGLSWINGIGLDLIGRRVRCLTGWLLSELAALRHRGGTPMAVIYGPPTMVGRGATVAFNVLDPDGAVVDERLVAAEAARAGISLRTGCFCNPGAGEDAFAITPGPLHRAALSDVETIDEYLALLGLPTGGAVRVSLGVVSTIGDIERLLDFVRTAYTDRDVGTDGLAPRLRC